jgi:hypothetical protein
MSLEREVGELRGTLNATEKRLSSLTHKIDSLDEKIDSILISLSEVRGGWKGLLMVVSISATVGAFFSKVFSFKVLATLFG